MNPVHIPFATGPMQGVERLSIVSKVLFDSRLIELRRENEALKLEQKRTIDAVKLEQKSRIDTLKLKVFWLEHDDLKGVHAADAACFLFLRFLVPGSGICSAGFVWSVDGFINPARFIASRMMPARIASSLDVACINCVLCLGKGQFTAPRHRVLLGLKKKTFQKINPKDMTKKKSSRKCYLQVVVPLTRVDL
jgi:hypothetical protein